MNLQLRHVVPTLVGSFAFGQPVRAQLTSDHQIPYQGHLDLDGAAVSGPFDFWLELYPTPTGGDCVATPPPSVDCLWADELTGVPVVGGEFSVVLGSATNPLGDAIWQNPEVYLGIRVTTSGDAYVLLTGRQRILAVPMAARADTAQDFHAAGALVVEGGATVSGGAIVSGGATVNGRTGLVGDAIVGGRVGIGVDPPLAALQVEGDIRLSGAHSYGTLKDWRLVFRDDFVDSGTLGWTGVGTSDCNGERILGGFNVIANGSVQKTYNLAGIPHSRVKVTLEYFAIDSWDSEWGWVRLDGPRPYLWNRQINVAEPGRYNVCGSSSYADGVYFAEVSGSHTDSSLAVTAGAALNEGPTTESFGIDHVEVWVR